MSISAIYFLKIYFNLFSLAIVAFPRRLMKCWPPLTPKTFPVLNPASKCSPWCLMGPFVQYVSIPRFTCIICAKFIPNRSSRLTTFHTLLNCWHPKPPQMPPWGIVGRIVFSLCPYPDESTDVYRIWCQSVHPFGSFPRLKFVTPLNPPKCPLWHWGANCI